MPKSQKKNEYTKLLNRFAANTERLHRVGITAFGFGPGFLCNIEGCRGSVVFPDPLVNIICELIKKVYPETVDDKKMIKEYKKRQSSIAALIKSRKEKGSR